MSLRRLSESEDHPMIVVCLSRVDVALRHGLHDRESMSFVQSTRSFVAGLNRELNFLESLRPCRLQDVFRQAAPDTLPFGTREDEHTEITWANVHASPHEYEREAAHRRIVVGDRSDQEREDPCCLEESNADGSRRDAEKSPARDPSEGQTFCPQEPRMEEPLSLVRKAIVGRMDTPNVDWADRRDAKVGTVHGWRARHRAAPTEPRAIKRTGNLA